MDAVAIPVGGTVVAIPTGTPATTGTTGARTEAFLSIVVVVVVAAAVVAAIGAAVAVVVEAGIAVVGAGAVAAAAAVGAVVAGVVVAPVACEIFVDDVAVDSDTSAGGFLLSSISRFLLRARSLRESGLSTSSPSFLYLLREKLTESLNSLDAGV